VRNPAGGFIEEPEFPHIAIDEAIVNAVAHRDYAANVPVECILYKDAFVVVNPGRILQRDIDLRGAFSLDTTTLVSTPRNPKLIEWLKAMRDRNGAQFVRALSEGTRRMRDEMVEAGLPPPRYFVSEAQTTVTLYSLASQREANIQSGNLQPPGEYTNLYPLTVMPFDPKTEAPAFLESHRQEFVAALRDALEADGWYIDHAKHGRLVAHRRGQHLRTPAGVAEVVRFFPAYSLQLRHHWGRPYLCVDFSLEVKSVQTVRDLLTDLPPEVVVGKRAVVRWKGTWSPGKIVAVDPEWVRVYLFDYEREEQLPSGNVIPNLSLNAIQRMLVSKGLKFDLHRAVKQFSLSLEPNAARLRSERTQATATDLSHVVFPLEFGGTTASLSPTPVPLLRQASSSDGLRVYSLSEPVVEFGRRRESADIREGVTTFGGYDDSPKGIEIVPICTPDQRDNMIALIERLRLGKYRYRGAERTFSTRLTYGTIVTVPQPEAALAECQRLLGEHPDWAGNPNVDRIFLVHTPEEGYADDDERSPYYTVKRYLLENGVPCQMIDSPTLANPDWKDLNLALNIVAKCGGVPWVLPDAIPDADFFVGFSYTQNARRGPERLMAFANVFNQYGRWMFYSGNTETFPYEERLAHYRTLVRQTLERLPLSETPSVHFHYSARFSRDARDAILEAARSIRPNGSYSFVWINTHHNVRLYDGRAETDGSLSRGSYVVGSPNQIYLSTTGYNPYRRAFGTPQMLEVNVRTERRPGTPDAPPDLRSLAVQILSLTKLNWKSTDSVCGEPITTKYAGDIADLTAAFLRQSPSFRLHPVLTQTPWFV